jgi:hypothetical protein
MKSQDEILENSIARLIASTRRTSRNVNLLEVAKEIRTAERILGSRKRLSQSIGLSEEMIREFTCVEKLAPAVKEMVRKGLLKGVDIAYRLSMLKASDQEPVAREFVEGKITGKDIKDIVSFRKRHPESPIQVAIKRVKSSRTIIQYVVEFPIDKNMPTFTVLVSRFRKLLGEKRIVSLKRRNDTGILIIDEDGQKRLIEKARKSGLTRRQVVKATIQGNIGI